ncbi:N-acetylornithine carbamoyltransferase [Gracilimonas mengyeensis]|uniref:N-succinylornithine carbamoyltransferase n=1 Tax=Gracilimonas mengyeensis TaxID=1302730 RepID=A0A521CD84_9BACT|nr:N-acetylornithine carbamoyltransferase [Gracilimonas mengyeensis]SMO57376.1 N-succinyl-L-ornithine transcarbamylase [Gracilimonas mengyeensis]
MNSFLSINDVENLPALVQEALEIKKNPHVYSDLGRQRSMCLIFLNPSLRTRLSSQKAAFNLGLDTAVLDVGSQGWNLEFADGVVMDGDKAEHIKEAAAVISSYFDVVAIRAFAKLQDREEDYSEQVMSAFKEYCPVPVINMESSTGHPLQAFADLITIEEHKKVEKPKVVLTWAPHPKALPQAVANSFSQWMQAANFDFTITHPEGYELADEMVGNAKVEYDQAKAFEGADFIYAKNWSNYKDYGKVVSKDSNWMVTQQKMQLTNAGKFMHCLPVRRNVVVEGAVLDSDQSIVIPQATNRIFSMQTVTKKILESTHS